MDTDCFELITSLSLMCLYFDSLNATVENVVMTMMHGLHIVRSIWEITSEPWKLVSDYCFWVESFVPI